MKIREALCAFFLLCGSSTFAEEVRPYSELVVTAEQEKDIHRLITTLARTSTFGLMFKKGELENIGKRTYGIHPLRYLGCIYSDPDLKQCMPKLLDKSMVGTRFIKEISDGLNEKLAEGQLVCYVPGFAAFLHLEPVPLMDFVDKRDWSGMINYLNFH
ncbi:MAG: hypothetical protein V4494_00700 [Chlamydiota bacterium]